MHSAIKVRTFRPVLIFLFEGQDGVLGFGLGLGKKVRVRVKASVQMVNVRVRGWVLHYTYEGPQ